MIERICTTCHKRIKPDSKLTIYCACDTIKLDSMQNEGNEIDANNERKPTKAKRPTK